ncbi:hypothetical protein J6590_001502 [Homalodisca vitripennis]|nr:hypothetical protein J6590_001502 [Homalodisca vitripennis]
MHHYCRYRNNRTTRCCPATHVSAQRNNPLLPQTSSCSFVIGQQDAVLPLTCRLSVTTLSSHRPLAVPLSLLESNVNVTMHHYCRYRNNRTTRCCPATLVSAQRNNPLLPQTSSCSFVIVGVKRECNDASLLSIPEQQDNKMLSCHSRVGSA